MSFIQNNKWRIIQSIFMISLILTYIIVLKNETDKRYGSKKSINNQTSGNFFLLFQFT
jgi:hypothetical protein